MFSVIFLYGLTHERAFSELHDHHSPRKALRLGRRATRDVLRTGSWRPDYSHIEQVRLAYQPITRRFTHLDLCDLQLCRSYPRYHSPYSMRVRVHNMLRCCTRYGLLLIYVGSSFSNPPSLVSTVPYVTVMGVHRRTKSIPGVVLLHLLLVPGTAFLVGGARVWEQKLHPHRSQLNLTLLTVGSVALF